MDKELHPEIETVKKERLTDRLKAYAEYFKKSEENEKKGGEN